MGSTKAMLERFTDYQKAIILALIDKKKHYEGNLLENSEWDLLADLLKTLSPYDSIITYVSTSKSIISSALLPIISNITQEILVGQDENSVTKSLKEVFLKDFNQRVSQYQDILPLLNVVTFLDPRFCRPYFTSREHQLEETRRYLHNFYNLNLKNNSMEVEDDSSQLNFENIEWMSAVFGLKFASQNTDRQSEGIELEMNFYQKEQILQINCCPLEWQKVNQFKYPYLSKIVQILFSIQITSVPCERVFSKAGFISNSKRQNLRGENLDQLIFLCHTYQQQQQFD